MKFCPMCALKSVPCCLQLAMGALEATFLIDEAGACTRLAIKGNLQVETRTYYPLDLLLCP